MNKAKIGTYVEQMKIGKFLISSTDLNFPFSDPFKRILTYMSAYNDFFSTGRRRNIKTENE